MFTQGLFANVLMGMALVLVAAPAGAQSRHGQGYGDGYGRDACRAVVYEHDGYRGEAMRLDGSAASLGRRWNDRISSIRVISGDWTFFRDDGYRGGQVDVDRDRPGLDRYWNDQISSAMCKGSGSGGSRGCEAIVYEDSGFRGEERLLDRDTPWIGDRWNDRISSIRVLSGQWVFYGDRGYRGAQYPLRRGEPAASMARGWNDRISSARCIN